MSAVYTVYAKFDYDDEEAVIARLNDYIDTHHGQGMVFSLDEYSEKGIPRDTMSGIMQYFLTDRGFQQDGPGEFQSEFNASYGWESVLIDMFEYVADLLEDGSRLEIYPDNGSNLMHVEGGRAVWD